MRAFFDKYGFGIFWLIAVTDFLLIFLNDTNLRYFTRPLLMPLLVVTLFSKVDFHERRTAKVLIFGSFVSATIADLFALSENGFVASVVCFSIALLLYIIYFFGVQKLSSRKLVPIVVLAAVLLSGFSLLIASLWNYMEGFKVPVIVRSFSLMAMFVAAVNILFKSETKPLAIDAFIPGSVLFIISDVMLAANKFYFEEPFLDIAIMATYCGAQYYICRGCVKELQCVPLPEKPTHINLRAAHQQFNLN